MSKQYTIQEIYQYPNGQKLDGYIDAVVVKVEKRGFKAQGQYGPTSWQKIRVQDNSGYIDAMLFKAQEIPQSVVGQPIQLSSRFDNNGNVQGLQVDYFTDKQGDTRVNLKCNFPDLSQWFHAAGGVVFDPGWTIEAEAVGQAPPQQARTPQNTPPPGFKPGAPLPAPGAKSRLNGGEEIATFTEIDTHYRACLKQAAVHFQDLGLPLTDLSAVTHWASCLYMGTRRFIGRTKTPEPLSMPKTPLPVASEPSQPVSGVQTPPEPPTRSQSVPQAQNRQYEEQLEEGAEEEEDNVPF